MFKSKTFIKYFVSYIALLIAVFSALTFIFSYTLSFIQDEIDRTMQSQFEQIGFYFMEKMSSLEDTVKLMCHNEYLTHFRLSSGHYMQINGINELKKIRASNNFVDDVLIYYKDEHVYSAKGKTSVNVYTQKILALEEYSAAIIEQVFSNSTEPGFYPLYSRFHLASDQPAYLFCSYPYIFNSRTIGVIGFIISSTTIRESLFNLLGDYGIGVRMLLPSGEIFAEVNRLREENPFDNINSSYLIYSYTIDKIGFEFNVAIDSNKAFFHIKQLQKFSYILISIVFVLSILISYLFSKRHYKPIKILNTRALENSEKNILGDTSNEFDTILRVMNYEKLTNEKLLRKLEESSFALQQQACALMFSGIIHGESRIKNLANLSKIRLDKPYYSVMIIVDSEKNWGRNSGSDIAIQLSNYFGGYYITSIMDRNAIVFVVGLNDCDSNRRIRKRVSKQIQKCFDDMDEKSCCICFGRVYDEINFISSSYEEAVSCAEQSILLSKGDSYAFFETMADVGQKRYCFDIQDIRKLIESLEKKDLKQSVICFNRMLEKLHSMNLSIEAQRFHYHDLLHQIYHYFSKRDMKLCEEIIEIDCSSTEKFIMQMEKLFHSICSYKEDATQQDIILDIINYIEDNYTNSDITLSSIAHKFHISPNYISRFFKENTGQNYMDYISSLRLKKAYKLICDTDLPIRDVALKVGYLDPVNFTKKFKKIYKCTPSELRLKQKQL